MAQFEIAFNITIGQNEGGYNPGNGEAETYAGWDISQHPNWAGWLIIHQIKKTNPGATIPHLDTLFKANVQLQTLVKAPYISDFWNSLKLSQVVDQQVANNLFDCSVNPCIDSPAHVMQKACNAVIINTGAKIPQLDVDGDVGVGTLTAINGLDSEHIFNAINTIRSANYHQRVILTLKDKPWLSVWLRRLLTYQPGKYPTT